MKIRRHLLLWFILIVLLLLGGTGLWLRIPSQQDILNRQLIDAIRKNDVQTAFVLVNAGANPNTLYDPLPTFRTSYTVMMIACDQPWKPSLVRQGHAIFWEENLPLIQAMLLHGGNVHARTSNDITIVEYASAADRPRTVELLLQHGANINAQDQWGRTPLMVAASNHAANLVGLLLAHHAKPDLQDIYGQTALHYAIQPPINIYITTPIAKKVISELLAYGADPNLRSQKGVTPFEVAQQLGRPDLVALLTTK